MTCEWTHHLSYDPGLVAVSIGHTKTIVENIRALKEFAVNLCVSDQSILSSVAGGYSGSKYDKISALKELGFQFYDANKIKTLMVKGHHSTWNASPCIGLLLQCCLNQV